MSEPKPGGMAKGQGQPGSRRGRRGVDPGVRGEPSGQPLQGLESDVLGELYAAAGQSGRDTEEEGRIENARRAGDSMAFHEDALRLFDDRAGAQRAV
jgi:hypothetical protein